MATKLAVEDTAAPDATAHTGFEKTLPENCVEYLIFTLDNTLHARRHLTQLETIRKSAIHLSNTLTKEYIWQKDEFNLTLKNEQGLIYLHGITDYSDAVEDEWLIVYLLREITKTHPNVWVRVFDTDGEFLLVEAANVLPKWLSPEIDRNRVWIHQGKLLIVPPTEGDGPKSRTLTLPAAVEVFKTRPESPIHSTFVEAEAFYRLEKYPGQISDSLHHSVITIPRKLAYILHSLQKSIAPAVEAFYLRDPLTLKRVISPSKPLIFPPSDLTTVSVRFSRILFAQLRSQRFDAPPSWRDILQNAQNDGSSDAAKRALPRIDTGMKLTCGFEMLAVNAEKSRNRVVRELAIMLEDLNEDGDSALPSDEEIASWKDVFRDDSEAWLDINYADFERELDGKRGDTKETGFGDIRTQSDIRKIVSRFEAFLNDDNAGVEGAELDEMDIDDDGDDSEEGSEYEDKEVSFDEEEFARMMREMMGLPPTEETDKACTKSEATRTVNPHENEEDEEIQKLTSEMEAELNSHGALRLDLPDETSHSLQAKASGLAYNDAEEDSEEEVDIDFNLARNLLESFKSQAGMAGPTGNMLGMMGIQLPRDEDEENEEEERVESSRRRWK